MLKVQVKMYNNIEEKNGIKTGLLTNNLPKNVFFKPIYPFILHFNLVLIWATLIKCFSFEDNYPQYDSSSYNVNVDK